MTKENTINFKEKRNWKFPFRKAMEMKDCRVECFTAEVYTLLYLSFEFSRVSCRTHDTLGKVGLRDCVNVLE